VRNGWFGSNLSAAQRFSLQATNRGHYRSDTMKRPSADVKQRRNDAPRYVAHLATAGLHFQVMSNGGRGMIFRIVRGPAPAVPFSSHILAGEQVPSTPTGCASRRKWLTAGSHGLEGFAAGPWDIMAPDGHQRDQEARLARWPRSITTEASRAIGSDDYSSNLQRRHSPWCRRDLSNRCRSIQECLARRGTALRSAR
jgi:hypothetical protein